MPVAVSEYGLDYLLELRTLAVRHYLDDALHVGGAGVCQIRRNVRTDIAGVLEERREAGQSQDAGLSQRHAGALRHRRQSPSFGQSLTGPDAGLTTLAHEIDNVVFGADKMPGVKRDVARPVIGQEVQLLIGEVAERVEIVLVEVPDEMGQAFVDIHLLLRAS